MKFLQRHPRLFALASLMLVPQTVFADGADIANIFLGLIGKFAPLWITIAILVVIIAGFGLLTTQDEGRLDKAKKTILAVTVGGILVTIILVMGPTNFVGIMYTGIPGFAVPLGGANTIGAEAVGVAGWITAMAVMLGILMIIIAAIQAIASFGEDEGMYTKVRTAIFHVIIGLIVIASAFIFQQVFFLDRTPNALIALIASKILILLFVILTIAVAILVYAGLRMILAIGREDEYTAAKSLLYRVVVGIIVILLSYVLVVVVAQLFS